MTATNHRFRRAAIALAVVLACPSLAQAPLDDPLPTNS